MAASRKPLYGSVAAAMEVGISLRQLYYWVEVLHAVHPENHPHGLRVFRRFTAQDLARLRAVKRLLERGYTLRAAVRLVNGRSGSRARVTCRRASSSGPAAPPAPSD